MKAIHQIFASHFPIQAMADKKRPNFTVNFVSDKDNKHSIVTNKVASERVYEANVHFNYDEEGNIKDIDVLIIAPMPDVDPNEPIPYEVTELGKAIANPHGKIFKISKNSSNKSHGL